MKLDKSTIEVLKSFSQNSTKFKAKAGNVIHSMSEGKTVLAKAEIKDTIPSDVYLYDLGEFLSVLGMFSDPDLEFGADHVLVAGDGGAWKYNFCDPATIVVKENVKMPSVVATALVTEVIFDKLKKANGIGGIGDVCFTSKAGKPLFVELKNKKTETSNVFKQVVGDKCDKSFSFNFKIDNLKHFFPGDYDVEFAEKGLAHFKNKKHPIEYWVAIESDSVFGE